MSNTLYVLSRDITRCRRCGNCRALSLATAYPIKNEWLLDIDDMVALDTQLVRALTQCHMGALTMEAVT